MFDILHVLNLYAKPKNADIIKYYFTTYQDIDDLLYEIKRSYIMYNFHNDSIEYYKEELGKILTSKKYLIDTKDIQDIENSLIYCCEIDKEYILFDGKQWKKYKDYKAYYTYKDIITGVLVNNLLQNQSIIDINTLMSLIDIYDMMAGRSELFYNEMQNRKKCFSLIV